ncbi:MAG: rhodanese-like domain-containing protein [Acidimicrobiales bacterium]
MGESVMGSCRPDAVDKGGSEERGTPGTKAAGDAGAGWNADLPDEVEPHHARRIVDCGGYLLDVREPHEWHAGHAPQAQHLPLGQLDPEKLPNDVAVVVVCRSGGRSARAAELLRGAGASVTNLSGGMLAWAQAGLPVLTDDGEPGRVE